MIIVLPFLRCGFDDFDGCTHVDVAKILVHRFDGGLAGRMFEPNDKEVFDKSARMKIAVETGDNLYGFISVVCDVIKMKVIRPSFGHS